MRVPWTARRSNQSILKGISPEYSLEGLMLKLQYFGHLKQRADSLEKTLMLGKIEGRRRGLQRMRWLDGIINSMDMSLSICFSVAQCVQLFVTPWTAACQASLSFPISQSLLKLMSIESVISSSVAPFSSCFQSFPSSGSFLVS